MAFGRRSVLTFATLVSVLLVSVLSGCCGCKSFRVKIRSQDSLEAGYSVPVDIYFAPADEVNDLQNVVTSEWFSQRRPELESKLSREGRRTMLVSATATSSSDQDLPLVANLPREVGTILVWGGLPDDTAKANRPYQIDPQTLEKHTLGIFTSSECSLVVEISSNTIRLYKAVDEP